MAGELLGHPVGALRVDALRPPELGEQGALLAEGRPARQLRLGRRRQGLGHTHGQGEVLRTIRNQYDTGPYSANSVCFDKSGTYIAVASDDGNIKILNESNNKIEATLKGHEDAVLDVLFDYNSKLLVSSSADFSFRVWS